MDEGSTITLIDAKTAETLGIRGPCVPLSLNCIKNVEAKDQNSQTVSFGISALDSNTICRISRASTIKDLNLFSQSLIEEDIRKYKHLSSIPLEYYACAKPLILIGQDHWDLITATQKRYTTRNHPIASLTRLGWVIHGRISTGRYDKEERNLFITTESIGIDRDPASDADLNKLIKFHFTFDSIGITNFQRKNKMEEKAEQILNNTSTYKNGHWEVGLIWKNDGIKLPNNRENALSRLKSLEKNG